MFNTVDEQRNEAEEIESAEPSSVETVYLPENEYKPGKDYSAVGFGTVAFFVAWHVLVILFSVLYFAVSGQSKMSLAYAILMSLVGEVLSVPVFILIVRKKDVVKPEKNKLTAGSMFSALSIVFFLGIAGNIIGRGVNSLISAGGGNQSVSDIFVYMNDELPLMAVYAAFVAPIIEEILFRKVLLDRIQQYGKSTALFTSGLLFGLCHGNLEQFFFAFFVGMLFAFIYLKTGDVKYPIILHMSMNGLSTFITYIMSKIPALEIALADPSEALDQIQSDPDQMTWLIFMIALVLLEYALAIIGLVIFLTHLKHFSFGEENDNIVRLKKCFVNPGMILCLIGFVTIIVLSVFGITI